MPHQDRASRVPLVPARHAGTEVGTHGHKAALVRDAFQRHVRVTRLKREEQQTGRIHTAGAGDENMARQTTHKSPLSTVNNRKRAIREFVPGVATKPSVTRQNLVLRDKT